MAITTASRTPSAKTYLEPGDATTCLAGAAIVYRRFVAVTTGGVGNHPRVIHATPAKVSYGVAHFGVPSGGQLSVLRMGTVEVEAGAVLASGDEVEVGAAGVAVKLAAGRPVGVCTADTANGGGAPITLY